MSSNALKVLAFLTLVLAVGLGFVAYRMSKAMSEPIQSGAGDGAPAPTMAIVALKPLAAYAPVPPDGVALVPVAVLPESYYSKPEDVVGRAPLTDVPVGTTLGPRYFREANTLVRSIPPGFQAMSLEINDVIAVGGFVRPGDLVDVLLYIRSTGREVEDSQARILLREARVLAYEERVLNDAEASDGLPAGQSGTPAPATSAKTTRQQSGRRIRTAVLAVPEADTTRVMLGASLGELRLALRGADAADDMPIITGQAVQDQVITLRELAAVRKTRAGAGQASPSPAIIIHRGNEVQQLGR